MFNLQPGMGLGFTGSKQIALGLGTPFVEIIPTPIVGGAAVLQVNLLGLRDDQDILDIITMIARRLF